MALVLAWRELRGGVRGLRIVIACLALGVAAIAGVGSLRAGIDDGLAVDGARILGGDISVAGGSTPLPDTLRSWFQGRGRGFRTWWACVPCWWRRPGIGCWWS